MGMEAFLPEFMDKHQKQFTTQEGNRSRMVTMIRWPVEAINGKLKQKFLFFAVVIRNTHLPNLNKYLQIACAILNAFSPACFTETELHERMVDLAVERNPVPNTLKAKIEENGLDKRRVIWTPVTDSTEAGFPELSLEDLQSITLGSYQIKLAPGYVDQHLKQDPRFMFHVHKEEEGLIRVKRQSRFTKRQFHTLWIQFVPNGSGSESITGYYCRCKAGARTVGTCAHVTSVSSLFIIIGSQYLLSLFVAGAVVLWLYSSQP
jgi:hypothetical protein